MESDDDADDAPRLVEQAYRCRWYDDRLCWWQGGWETVRAMWPAQAAARYMARHPRGIVDLHGVAVMDEQGARVVVKLVEVE